MDAKKIDNESRRIIDALSAVLPANARLRFMKREGGVTVLSLAGRRLRACWITSGWPGQIKVILDTLLTPPDLVVAPQMSPGARALLSQEGIGWVDELGGAHCALGNIIISRTGHPPPPRPRTERWSPSVLAVAEAMLCGVTPTVDAVRTATLLSTGATTNALGFLTHGGFLEAAATRGRHSARRLKDADHLLEAYCTAVAERAESQKISLMVGGTWRVLLTGIKASGQEWDKHKIAWATTGAAAAEVLAPTMTTLGSALVYVQADTVAELEGIARKVGLQPIEGGRITLKPFPTVTALHLATTVDGLKVVPWPRVYADLKMVGVRGEDAAEHLREVMREK